MCVFTGLLQTVVTGSLPWNEEGIELDYNKNFHTRLLVPLRDFIQDGIHFAVIKTKHMYVLEDPNALQNMETKPPASAKSKRRCFFVQNPTICYVSYKIIAESTLQTQYSIGHERTMALADRTCFVCLQVVVKNTYLVTL